MSELSDEEIKELARYFESIKDKSDTAEDTARALRQLMAENRQHKLNTFNRLAAVLDEPVSPARQAILDRVEECVNAGWGGELDVQGVARLTLECAEKAGLISTPPKGDTP